jgi:hypothetical protein
MIAVRKRAGFVGHARTGRSRAGGEATGFGRHADAVATKFMSAPLTREQISELVRMPIPPK